MALNKRDREELARSRAKQRGKVIVKEDDGNTLTERTPEEAAAIQGAKSEAAKQKIFLESPAGQEFLAKQAKVGGIAETIGQPVDPNRIDQVVQDPVSQEQAIKAGVASAVPGIAGGAVAGGAAGLIGGPAAPVTVPVAAVGGAILGGVSTFISGYRNNLKTQKTDIVKGESQNLMKNEQNMLKMVMNVNKGGDPVIWSDMYLDQMGLIDENYARLNLELDQDLNKWLGEDAHKQLEKYETFNGPGGMREILDQLMREAILNPDPNKDLSGLAGPVDYGDTE